MVDPFSLGTVGTIMGIVSSAISISKAVKEWRNGNRNRVELAKDRNGGVHSLRHDGSALMAPQALLPQYSSPALLCGSFVPADDVSARRLSWSDQALVAVWPYGSVPEYESILFSWQLDEDYAFALELAGGTYNVAAVVFDERRDDIRGATDNVYLHLPWSTRTDLTLPVFVSEAEWASDQLAAVVGDTIAELLLPSGLRVPLSYNTVIGRDQGCAVVVDDVHINPAHAQIQFSNDRYWVYDLGSVNGTCVNNQLLNGSWPLRHGDMISFPGWGYVFEFRYR